MYKDLYVDLHKSTYTTEKLMIDITDRVLAYRECCRHLWNSYFLKVNWYEMAWWDYWEYFAVINKTLFEKTVLEQVIGNKLNIQDSTDFYHQVRVEPQLGPLGFDALYAKKIERTFPWKSVTVNSNRNDFRFIKLFDWSVEKAMDYQYTRVRLVESSEFPELVGYDFLLESRGVSFAFIC